MSTEEKIRADEVLSEEELEQVAGGDSLNTWHDFNFLSSLGIISGSQWDDDRLVPKGWAKVGITCVLDTNGDYENAQNKYFLNGNEISHAEAVAHAKEWRKNHNPILDKVKELQDLLSPKI